MSIIGKWQGRRTHQKRHSECWNLSFKKQLRNLEPSGLSWGWLHCIVFQNFISGGICVGISFPRNWIFASYKSSFWNTNTVQFRTRDSSLLVLYSYDPSSVYFFATCAKLDFVSFQKSFFSWITASDYATQEVSFLVPKTNQDSVTLGKADVCCSTFKKVDGSRWEF